MTVGVKANFVVLVPTNPGVVPNGSLFIDQSNANAASFKDTSGGIAPINSVSQSLFIKQMEAVGPIALHKPVSKRPDGRIQVGDSDAGFGQMVIGFALEPAAALGDLINVLCVGANIANAIVGLGYTPGQEVYLSETGGFTNDPNSFTGDNDSLIKVGVADCSAGIASGTATDLIVFTEVVARP